MGLNNNTSSGALSPKLAIVGGKFVLRVEEGTEGSESRQLTKGKNEGNTVWEMKYPSLFGSITSGIITSGEYPGVDIVVDDGEESYTINFPLDSRYLFDLIKRLPNIDTSKSVNIEIVEHPKKKTRQGNPTFNLHLVQDGLRIHDYYIEWKSDASGNNIHELLHGMPDAVEGRSGWSFEAQENWLLDKFEEFFTDFQAPDVDEPQEDRVPDTVTDAGELVEEAPADFEEPIPF